MAVPEVVPAKLLASRAVDQLAVVVIDVQTGLFNTHAAPFEAREVIQRINRMTTAARVAGVRVFLIQHEGPPGGDWLLPGSNDWKLHPDLVTETSDVTIRKQTADAFYKTDLEKQLRSRGVETLVLTGYATEFCVDSTLRNAASKEFEVFVVADAHTTTDAPMLKGRDIRAYFNWVWGESSSARGIHLVETAEVSFSGVRAGSAVLPR